MSNDLHREMLEAKLAKLAENEEKLMLAMSALTEIWSCHMENDSGNLTEILTHYKETMGLDIPEGGF